jgi:hypothetical protein
MPLVTLMEIFALVRPRRSTCENETEGGHQAKRAAHRHREPRRRTPRRDDTMPDAATDGQPIGPILNV